MAHRRTGLSSQAAAAVLLLLVLANLPTRSASEPVTLVFPFNSDGVPLVNVPGRALAGFKTATFSAFVNALEYIASTTILGPGGVSSVPPAVPPPRTWTFNKLSTPQTATVVFDFSDLWIPAVAYLVMNPTFIYFNGGLAGVNLQSQYGALAGNTIAFGPPAPLASPSSTPPVPVGLTFPPPPLSPPVPVAIPPPPPIPAAVPISPAAPPPPATPVQGTLLIVVTIASPYIPLDTAGGELLLATFYDLIGSYIALYAPLLPPLPCGPAVASWQINPTLLTPVPSTGRRRLSQTSVFNVSTALNGSTWTLQGVLEYQNVSSLHSAALDSGPGVIPYISDALQSTFQIPPPWSFEWTAFFTPFDQVCVARRRMSERSAPIFATLVKPAAPLPAQEAVKPAEVSYDPLSTAVYEIFTQAFHYYEAGTFCASRGARLADYHRQGAHGSIENLCEDAAGATCWVEGNGGGTCSALQKASLLQLSCIERLPFVCVKNTVSVAAAAIVKTEPLSAAAAADLTLGNPADAALDTHRNRYELFSVLVDYQTAISACLSRGAELVHYAAETTSNVVNMLCKATGVSVCWVTDGVADHCLSVRSSELHLPELRPQTPCNQRHPFICVKTAFLDASDPGFVARQRRSRL